MLLEWYEHDLSLRKIMCGIGKYEYWADAQLYVRLGKSVTCPITWGGMIILLYCFSNFGMFWHWQAKEVPGEWMFELTITQFLKHTAIFGLVPCESAKFTWKLIPSSCVLQWSWYVPHPRSGAYSVWKEDLNNFTAKLKKKGWGASARWYFPKL